MARRGSMKGIRKAQCVLKHIHQGYGKGESRRMCGVGEERRRRRRVHERRRHRRY